MEQHELVHIGKAKYNGDSLEPDQPGQNEECLADGTALNCVASKLGECMTDKLPRAQQERCLVILREYVRSIPCCEDRKSDPACPKDEKKDCKENQRKLRDTINRLLRTVRR